MRYFDRKKLKKRRETMAWSFEDVSSHIARMGKQVSYGTIRNWEIGKTVPDANDVEALAYVFDCGADDFYTQEKRGRIRA